MEHYRNPLWTVQAVSVVKDNGNYIETILMDYPTFHVHGTSLAEVHESRDRRTAGNVVMTAIWEKSDSVFTNGFLTDDGVVFGQFVDDDRTLQ